MFWFIFIPFAWKNILHNVQKYELLRNYLPASRFFMVHKGSHTHCAGIKTPPPSPQCAPAAHPPARRAEITFVKTRRKPHWRKTKKQGRKSKICPTYFKISQTFFLPPENPHEQRPERDMLNADKNRWPPGCVPLGRWRAWYSPCAGLRTGTAASRFL